MSDDQFENSLAINNLKRNLSDVVSRLEEVAGRQFVSAKELASIKNELSVAHEEIDRLKEINKLVSTHLDNAITQVHRILDN